MSFLSPNHEADRTEAPLPPQVMSVPSSENRPQKDPILCRMIRFGFEGRIWAYYRRSGLY